MTYQVERLSTGTITAYALLNTSSYLLSNWTIQTDQTYIDWQASLPEYGMRTQFQGGLELGSGRRVSPYSGVLDFFLLTEDMQSYIYTDILNSKPVELVTFSAYDDETREVSVFTGEMVAPYFANAEATYKPNGHRVFSNSQYLVRGCTKIEPSYLLLTTGDYLLLTTGGKLGLVEQG
jgi:hypothetical protein